MDVVAKSAAARQQAPSELSNFLRSAKALLTYKAAVLGHATFTANNCMVEVTDANGVRSSVSKRDTTERAARRSQADEVDAPSPHPPTPSVFSRRYIREQLQFMNQADSP